MSEIKRADYIGFSFNGIHSSELGIVRTSEGSRFNENLLPTIQDKTVQVPGGDGMYHFGSYYTQRQFNISYAFDALTEEQLARIRAVFGDKKIHELIFDEAPYKKYYAKVTGSASIKHIPFGEGALNRIYKGEGSIQFTAYDPYGHIVKKFLDDPYYKDWNNIAEWNGAACLQKKKAPTGENEFDVIAASQANAVRLYNPGVKDADFTLTLDFKGGIIPKGSIYIWQDEVKKLKFNSMSKQGDDIGIKINTKLNLIEGYKIVGDIEQVTGNIYNQYITGGDFFKIPCSRTAINPNGMNSIYLILENSQLLASSFNKIDYDYLYF